MELKFNDPLKPRKLYEMFDLTKERKLELSEIIANVCQDYMSGKRKQKKHVPIAAMLQEISVSCASIEEVAYTSFVLGEVLEKSRKPPGGLGGVLGAMISLSIGKGQEGGFTGGGENEDPIAKLIRESEKINGKYGDKGE